MLFAEQGGEGVVVDTQGKVYPATGEVFVYEPLGCIDRHDPAAGETFAIALRTK